LLLLLPLLVLGFLPLPFLGFLPPRGFLLNPKLNVGFAIVILLRLWKEAASITASPRNGERIPFLAISVGRFRASLFQSI